MTEEQRRELDAWKKLGDPSYTKQAHPLRQDKITDAIWAADQKLEKAFRAILKFVLWGIFILGGGYLVVDGFQNMSVPTAIVVGACIIAAVVCDK